MRSKEVPVNEQRCFSSNERAATYATFAYLLTNPPIDSAESPKFLERTAVPCSPGFVPLSEQCIRDARRSDGCWSFGATDGAHARHVARCYQRAGFDHRRLRGHDALVRSLRPDALAAECAFVAFLLMDAKADAGRYAFANAFVQTHLGTWIEKASRICHDVDSEDALSRLVSDCAAFVTEDLRDIDEAQPSTSR